MIMKIVFQHVTDTIAFFSRTYPIRVAFSLSMLMFLILSACDSTPSAQQEAASLKDASFESVVSNLTSDLSLNATQSNGLRAVFSKNETQAPGGLWYAAKSLQSTLSDTQKEHLFDAVQPTLEKARKHDRYMGDFRNSMGWDLAMPFMDQLTEEQKTTVSELRTKIRSQFKDLRIRRESGELAMDSFRSKAKLLRGELIEQVQALLTPEQKKTLAKQRDSRRTAMSEAKDASMAARTDVLGLTPDQQDALKVLTTEHRDDIRSVMDGVRGADREAVRAKIMELHASHKAALAEILTDGQQELVHIHHALVMRVMKQRGSRQGFGHIGMRMHAWNQEG